MAVNLAIIRARSANHIVVDELARLITARKAPLLSIHDVEASGAALAGILLVKPAEHLDDYRILYCGDAIASRFGGDLSGLTFSTLLNRVESVRPCLLQYQEAFDTRQKIVSRRRTDFSANWIIEYTRTIVPVICNNNVEALIGGYVFHDNYKASNNIL